MTEEKKIGKALSDWKRKMQKPPSFTNELSKKFQNRINRAIPEKIQHSISEAIRQMTKAFLFGAELTAPPPLLDTDMTFIENKVAEKIRFYRNTAAAEGAITGAGGILLGLADFPIWLALKLKMLTEIASLYGKDVSRLSERIYILHIFELTFSSQQRRNQVFHLMQDWDKREKEIPEDINQFDWRRFQQEYRDYIDIAKLLQLIPGIGAAIGAVVNHRLTNKLGETAMNAYRMRLTS